MRDSPSSTYCTMGSSRNIAVFVSPHGFGHAARAAAILDSLAESEIPTQFQVYTTVPRGFFESPNGPPFEYRYVVSDVGMIQRTPFEEDLQATLEALDGFLPFRNDLLDDLVEQVTAAGTHAIVADISPLGVAVAERSRRPCILIENFTWDWIYEGYSAEWPQLVPYIETLSDLYSTVDLRIQTEPYCLGVPGGLVVPPISRRPCQSTSEIRRRLALAERRPLVVVTMAGHRLRRAFLDHLQDADDLCFVVVGGAKQPIRRQNLRLLPFESRICHPSLLSAADVVVGKLGYSTLAEVYRSRTPFAFVPRPQFPESPILEKFLRRNLPHSAIPLDRFDSCDWIPRIRELAALPKPDIDTTDTEAARMAATHILALT